MQGCAGGVSAMVLASQMAELSQSNVAVALADAARQSVSEKNKLRQFFGNGAFACTIEFEEGSRKLIHHKTKQYENLSKLVTVKLGHQAHHEIISNQKEVMRHPLENLGLSMNPMLALKLLRHAEEFYTEFVSECRSTADVMVFHQVNPDILKSLQGTFAGRVSQFVNVADRIGNCGAASFAIAMDAIKKELPGKKVFLCSFGTGGVISAGLWQF